MTVALQATTKNATSLLSQAIFSVSFVCNIVVLVMYVVMLPAAYSSHYPVSNPTF
jgi:hypothetical protein